MVYNVNNNENGLLEVCQAILEMYNDEHEDDLLNEATEYVIGCLNEEYEVDEDLLKECAEYILEHGGAHRKFLDNRIKASDDLYDQAEIYKDIADSINTGRAKDKIGYKALDLSNKAHNLDSVYRDINAHQLRDRIDGKDARAGVEYGPGAKRLVGAGKKNMPKDREAGLYLKAQIAKKKLEK